MPSQSGPGSCSPQPESTDTGNEPMEGAMMFAVSNALGKLLAKSAVASTSCPALRRLRRASACKRPWSVNPVQLRGPPTNRSIVARDSPCRTSTSRVEDTLDQASFSTKASSWRKLRHSKTPSVWTPYSPTIESPVFQYERGSGFSQYTLRAFCFISLMTQA